MKMGEIYKRRLPSLAKMILLSVVTTGFVAYGQETKSKDSVSFKNDVFPVIKRACLPCHAEDNFNPSELSLDSRELLMAGGKHGVAVLPGKPDESILLHKLSTRPPFGDRMPLDPKRKKGELSRKSLTEEEISVIREWVSKGAKDN
jgi:hypothetical protein